MSPGSLPFTLTAAAMPALRITTTATVPDPMFGNDGWLFDPDAVDPFPVPF